MFNLECSIGDDEFKTQAGLQKHKVEHMEEIEKLYMSTPTNGYDILKCNLCSFKSGHEDSIKEHFIDHLNCTKEREKKSEERVEKEREKFA